MDLLHGRIMIRALFFSPRKRKSCSAMADNTHPSPSGDFGCNSDSAKTPHSP